MYAVEIPGSGSYWKMFDNYDDAEAQYKNIIENRECYFGIVLFETVEKNKDDVEFCSFGPTCKRVIKKHNLNINYSNYLDDKVNKISRGDYNKKNKGQL